MVTVGKYGVEKKFPLPRQWGNKIVPIEEYIPLVLSETKITFKLSDFQLDILHFL